MTQSDAPNEGREEKVRCPTCNGSGQDAGYKRVPCKTCDGDGEIPIDQQENETFETELDLTYKHWNKAVEENKELRDQLSKEREMRKELVGYVIAYRGLASLTSDEDIFIGSLLKKASELDKN